MPKPCFFSQQRFFSKRDTMLVFEHLNLTLVPKNSQTKWAPQSDIWKFTLVNQQLVAA